MIPAGYSMVEASILSGFLSLARPCAVFMSAPLFSNLSVPMAVRLALALALGVSGTGFTGQIDVSGLSLIELSITLGVEILIGLLIGFICILAFSISTMAGDIISNAMGLGLASMIDPTNNTSSTMIGQLLTIVMSMIFLVSDGEKMIFYMISESYDLASVGEYVLSDNEVITTIEFFVNSIMYSLSIALPMTGGIIFVQIINAIISRSAPQLNIFSAGMAIVSATSLIMLAFLMPSMVNAMLSNQAEILQSAKIGSTSHVK